MTLVNWEKLGWQFARRKQLEKENKLDLIKRMDSIEYNADLGILALEGLEVTNGLAEDIAVQLVLSRDSGRFYLDIHYDIEKKNKQPKIKTRSHGWIQVEEVNS